MSGSVSPYTSQRISYEESPYQEWLRGVITNPNSGVSLGLKDSAQRAKLAMGVNAGDPKALKKFWGYQPTKEDFAAMQRGSSDFYRGVSQASKNTPKGQTAAQGGLMALRGYAPGGTTETPEEKFKRLEAKKAKGEKLTAEQQAYRKNYSATVAAGGTPSLTNGKSANPEAPATQVGNKGLDDEQAAFVKQMSKLAADGKELTQAQKDRLNRIEQKTGRDVSPYTDVGTVAPSNPTIAKAAEQMQSSYKQEQENPPGEGQQRYTPSQAMYGQIAGYDSTQKEYGGITNEYGRKAIDMATNMKMPDEYGQASDMYRTAGAGLQGLAGYSPQQVAAERAAAQQASAERASAAQMAAIADVQASQMQRPEDVQAQRLERYQMEGKVPEATTKDLEAYQMAGPGSWTEEGVSQKYMSPYMQGVIDISKREAERDYLKQANALNAKAISAGAFGGSRQALERSEAQRNYNQQLQDMQVKGLQQAYESGRSQYGQELNLSQQTALQNLQSKLSTQSQSSQQQLQAMLSNQNIDYQTKVQNLQAMLGVQSQEAQQMLQAALANQQTAFGTGQTNAQLAQQAALANQQTQFGVGSLNANLLNQTNLQNASLGTQASLANAQLGTQTNLANAQNALNASLANQQAGLQGNQQNIAAYGAMGNMASGLGAIGTNIQGYNQQQLGNMAQIYNTTQGLEQSWLNQQQKNAINQMMGPQEAAKFGIPAGAPVSTAPAGQVSQGPV